MVEPKKLHTILTTLFHWVQSNMKEIVNGSFECEVTYENMISNKLLSIVDYYNVWHPYLTYELKVQMLSLDILELVP